MMRRRWLFGTLAALIALSSFVPTDAAAQDPTAPAARGGIVFVGSSIFHRWTDLQKQMAPLPVLNRALDGLQTTDVLRSLDSDLVRSRPKVIAYYCGSNDVDAGDAAEAIFDRIRQFIVRVEAALPGTRVVFVSINRAPEKRDRWDVVDAVNHLVQMYAAQTKHVQYVDVNPVLFNRDGKPRLELYLSAGLHFRPAAYEEFTRILKPVLTRAYETP